MRIAFTGSLLVILAACGPNMDKWQDLYVDTGIGTDGVDPSLVDGDNDGYTPADGDCNDNNENVHPGAIESCNQLDDNCDGEADEGVRSTFYQDLDADGYGDPDASLQGCEAPSGYVSDSSDCNDLKGEINPGQAEICDGVDNDCDGTADQAETWYPDSDSDGYGDGDLPIQGGCSGVEGYSASGDDCDDNDASVNPGASETCNDVDDNCDGTVDEDVMSTFYGDSDSDGYGDAGVTSEACDAPSGYVSDDTDCDDADSSIHPGALESCNSIDDDCDGLVDDDDPDGVSDPTTWYADSDSDGYGDASGTTTACDQPSGYVADDTDCDDTDSGVNPGATEVCDGSVDEDCDGLVDDDDDSVTGTVTWYADVDGDGYGDPDVTAEACEAPSGYVADNSDCDDSDGAISPADSEYCDGVDNDCDGTVDEEDAVDADTWYADADGDGYGDASSTTTACDEAPSGYVSDDTDCDDLDSSVNPTADEYCNGIDNDCDGTADNDAADADTWYADADGDGYGDPDSTEFDCSEPSGYVADASDCDDSDAAVSPADSEYCDGIDNDCDGEVDEADAADASTWYADSDSDGYGDSAVSATACDQPSGYVADATDCDDGESKANPGEVESCDGIDNDCDGYSDDDDPDGVSDPSDWYIDTDGDGYGVSGIYDLSRCAEPSGYADNPDDCDDSDLTVSPGEAETCDGVDNDCDGSVDEDDVCDESDDDGDGYAEIDGDCDDTDSAVNPDATEVCDSVDNDCDGDTDENDAADADTWYADSDSDGYGDASGTTTACDQPSGYVADATDCDDTDSAVNPGASEVCDGSVDEDCDGLVDDDDDSVTGTIKWKRDADGDGYGDRSDKVSACDQPSGYVRNGKDCDDTDSAVNPDAEEVCDGIDNDCDGLTDQVSAAADTGTAADTGVVDLVCDTGTADTGTSDTGTADTGTSDTGGSDTGSADTSSADTSAADTAGSDTGSALSCTTDSDGDGYIDESCGGQDCDDTTDLVNPVAVEACDDGEDNNCDGLTDSDDPTARCEVALICTDSGSGISIEFTIESTYASPWQSSITPSYINYWDWSVSSGSAYTTVAYAGDGSANLVGLPYDDLWTPEAEDGSGNTAWANLQDWYVDSVLSDPGLCDIQINSARTGLVIQNYR